MRFIITAERPLRQMYGPDGYQSILEHLNRLAELPRWEGARVIAVDNEKECHKLTPGVSPTSVDSIEINRWLARVEQVQGDLIEHLLIAGGDSVIPFHRISPDPTGDDKELLSDNPYAARDLDFILPDRAVGRIPNPNDSTVVDFLDLLGSTIGQNDIINLNDSDQSMRF